MINSEWKEKPTHHHHHQLFYIRKWKLSQQQQQLVRHLLTEQDRIKIDYNSFINFSHQSFYRFIYLFIFQWNFLIITIFKLQSNSFFLSVCLFVGQVKKKNNRFQTVYLCVCVFCWKTWNIQSPTTLNYNEIYLFMLLLLLLFCIGGVTFIDWLNVKFVLINNNNNKRKKRNSQNIANWLILKKNHKSQEKTIVASLKI